MARIKICGITNLEDALLAVQLGADALGFIFAESPRRINLSQAQEIIKKIPPLVSCIGVFVNESQRKIKDVAQRCSLDCIQLHGQESPEYCQGFFPLKIIKSIRIKDEKSLKEIKSYSWVKAILLDTFLEGKAGGTGITFNWPLAKKAQKAGIPIILSGGLSPENVQKAIELVKPFAVDVSSGVESYPGKKDKKKLEAFIKIVKETA